jgi:conjugative relaxase-like TrwC/TraI family protein
MLSIGPVKGSTGPDDGGAGSYYEEADDYYRQGERAESAWRGQGAARLGLAGVVDRERFQALLRGEIGEGHHVSGREGKRRGGTDLTFSAPKSLSIEALVLGDARLIDAHERAVAKALETVERLAEARNGERTGAIVAASFRHTVSRNADPQLHTHNVVINAARRADGKWTAMQEKRFFEATKELGAVYRAELAAQVQSLGYEIRRTHADGRFELAHYTEEQIRAFSTRSADVERALAARGLNREMASGALKAREAKASRRAKQTLDRALLREAWAAKAAELGIAKAPERRADPEARPARQARSLAAAEAVEYAIQHLSEREAAFPKGRLRQAALEHATGAAGPDEIDAAIGKAIADRRLLERTTRQRGAEVAPLEGVARESAVLRIHHVGRGAFRDGIAAPEQVAARLAKTALTAGQREAVTLITTTHDRVVGVQGRAGTGKTTMLAEVRGLAEESGWKVVGLGPSGRAALEMRSAGIEAMTIAKFKSRESPLDKRTLLVIDESSMVSARDARFILRQVEEAGARAVLVGDSRQIKAVEAGRPFQQLQAAGMRVAHMNEIQRQTHDRYREAVRLAAEGHGGEALALIRANLREVKEAEVRYHQIAADYAALAEAERARTLILSGTNEARHAINRAVRERLGLAGQGLAVEVLARRDLTRAQLRDAKYYRVGDVIEFERAAAGFAQGERGRVVEIDGDRGLLRLARGRETVEFAVGRPRLISVYEAQRIELAAGDRVQFTKGDREDRYQNRELAQVVGVDAGTVRLRVGDRQVELDARDPLHLSHGYASTYHSAQGATTDRVILDLDTRARTTNDASFYVGLSRGRRYLRVYTDSLAGARKAVLVKSEKRAALDVLPGRGRRPPDSRQLDHELSR